MVIIKECPKHGLTEHILLKNGSYKCKECRKDAVIDIRRRNKINLVEYKGGKCEICGYNKCIDALEFHHLNPKEKEFGLSCGYTKSLEKLKKEADKCILICANCHREIHSEEIENKRQEKNKLKKLLEEQFLAKKEKNKVNKNKAKPLKLEDIKEDILNNVGKKEIAKKNCISLSSLKRFLNLNGIVYEESKKNKLDFLNKEMFINDFKELGSFVSVGKKYSVSDKALQKWCIRNNLPWRKKELTDFINKI